MAKYYCVYFAGSNLPQYPAAGPFTQLIYKNINVPVYTTLKGVSEVHHWRFTVWLDLCLSATSVCQRSVFMCAEISWGGVFTLLYSFTCFRKPLRSAVYLYPMMTLGLRMTAALWPVYGPPSWVRTGRAASLEARVLSREVRTADYSADRTVKTMYL